MRCPCLHRFLRAMRNYLHDEDSQDIYLEVAILVTDEKQAPRQALLEVRPTESESPGHRLFGVVIICST